MAHHTTNIDGRDTTSSYLLLSAGVGRGFGSVVGPERPPTAARGRLPLRWRAEAAVGGGDGSRAMATAPASLHVWRWACARGTAPFMLPVRRRRWAVGGGAEASATLGVGGWCGWSN